MKDSSESESGKSSNKKTDFNQNEDNMPVDQSLKSVSGSTPINKLTTFTGTQFGIISEKEEYEEDQSSYMPRRNITIPPDTVQQISESEGA